MDGLRREKHDQQKSHRRRFRREIWGEKNFFGVKDI